MTLFTREPFLPLSSVLVKKIVQTKNQPQSCKRKRPCFKLTVIHLTVEHKSIDHVADIVVETVRVCIFLGTSNTVSCPLKEQERFSKWKKEACPMERSLFINEVGFNF